MRLSFLLFASVFAFTLATQIAQTQEVNKGLSKQVVSSASDKAPAVQELAGMGMLTTAWLKWTPYEAEGFAVAGYKIYRKNETGDYTKPLATLGPVTSWTDYGLEKGEKYFYKISAYATDGKETELSNELSVETAIKAPFQPYIGEINIRQIPTLNVLCAVYYGDLALSLISLGGIPKEAADKVESNKEAEKIKNGIETARLFIWKNSRCRINLNIEYALIEEEISITENSGMKSIEDDLRKRGYLNRQFDIIFAASPNIKETKGGFELERGIIGGMGGVLYSELLSWEKTIPEKDALTVQRRYQRFPIEDKNINESAVWSFTKPFCESFDVILKKNNLSPVFTDNFSNGFYSAAKGLAALEGLDKLKTSNNAYIEVFDIDNDGIPDADDRVPIDEARLPSDAKYKDTDNDYLDDMDELTASIWRSSNNVERDTDKDKLVDGKDPLPLVDFQPIINTVKFIPSIDGKIEDTWKVLSKGCFWSTIENPNITVYAGWDSSNLYIAVKSDKKRDITLKIIDDPKSSKTRDYLLKWEGKEALLYDWTKITDGDKPLPAKTGILAHWIGDDGTFQTEASIPMEKETLKLEKGKKTLFQLFLTNPEDENDSIWVTEFNGFLEVTFK